MESMLRYLVFCLMFCKFRSKGRGHQIGVWIVSSRKVKSGEATMLAKAQGDQIRLRICRVINKTRFLAFVEA